MRGRVLAERSDLKEDKIQLNLELTRGNKGQLTNAIVLRAFLEQWIADFLDDSLLLGKIRCRSDLFANNLLFAYWLKLAKNIGWLASLSNDLCQL